MRIKTLVDRGVLCSHHLLLGQSELPAATVLGSASERSLKFSNLDGTQNKKMHRK